MNPVESYLQEVLHDLAPERVLEPILADVRRAQNTFVREMPEFRSPADLQEFLSEFACHLDNALMHYDPPRPLMWQLDWFRCQKYLRKDYGRDIADKAFDDVVGCHNGGLERLLRLIADGLIEEIAGNRIGSIVSEFLNGLSIESTCALADAYVERYADFLPRELTDINNYRAHIRFRKILEHHPYMLREIRAAQY